jgi:hypothetical protein
MTRTQQIHLALKVWSHVLLLMSLTP